MKIFQWLISTKYIINSVLFISVILSLIYTIGLYKSGYILLGNPIDLDLFSKAMAFFNAIFSGLIVIALIISYRSYKQQKEDSKNNELILLKQISNIKEQNFQNTFFNFMEYVHKHLYEIMSEEFKTAENIPSSLKQLEEKLNNIEFSSQENSIRLFSNLFSYTNKKCRFLYENYGPILTEIINLRKDNDLFNYKFYYNILFSTIEKDKYIYFILLFIQREDFSPLSENCLYNLLLSDWGNTYGKEYPSILNYCIQSSTVGEIILSD